MPHDLTQHDGFGVSAAILVMAVATYAMRAGGFWLMAFVPLTPRLRRMIEALPGSVVVARRFLRNQEYCPPQADVNQVKRWPREGEQ